MSERAAPEAVEPTHVVCTSHGAGNWSAECRLCGAEALEFAGIMQARHWAREHYLACPGAPARG